MHDRKERIAIVTRFNAHTDALELLVAVNKSGGIRLPYRGEADEVLNRVDDYQWERAKVVCRQSGGEDGFGSLDARHVHTEGVLEEARLVYHDGFFLGWSVVNHSGCEKLMDASRLPQRDLSLLMQVRRTIAYRPEEFGVPRARRRHGIAAAARAGFVCGLSSFVVAFLWSIAMMDKHGEARADSTSSMP